MCGLGWLGKLENLSGGWGGHGGAGKMYRGGRAMRGRLNFKTRRGRENLQVYGRRVGRGGSRGVRKGGRGTVVRVSSTKAVRGIVEKWVVCLVE